MYTAFVLKIVAKAILIIEIRNRLNNENPIKEYGNWYIQSIFNGSRTLYRAVANSIYWIKKKYSDARKRNLGYFVEVQTKLADLYFSKMIDWIKDEKNSKICYNITRLFQKGGKK